MFLNHWNLQLNWTRITNKEVETKVVSLKKDPNDESRFLIENPTRSDFFIVLVNVGFVFRLE